MNNSDTINTAQTFCFNESEKMLKATQKETPSQRYMRLQAENGLKVGDFVKVLRVPEDFEDGWSLWSTMGMRNSVNKTFEVIEIDSCYGIKLKADFWYPFFVLEKVKTPQPVLAPGHNPNMLTVEQVGEEYRLLNEDEVISGGSVSMLGQIEFWLNDAWDATIWAGSSMEHTYRVRAEITPEKLRELRGLAPKRGLPPIPPTAPKPEIRWPEGTTANHWEKVTDLSYRPQKGDLRVRQYDGYTNEFKEGSSWPTSWWESHDEGPEWYIYRRKGNSAPAIVWPEGTTADDWERVMDKEYKPRIGDVEHAADIDPECVLLFGHDSARTVGWFEDSSTGPVRNIYRRKQKPVETTALTQDDLNRMVVDGGWFFKYQDAKYFWQLYTNNTPSYRVVFTRDPINGPWYPSSAVPVNLLPWRKQT